MADYTLPQLPYAFDALEPSIDARTMEIHHDKHHAAYVNNLNAALKDHASFQGMPIEQLIARSSSLPESIRTAVRNNGGGHANHSLFWTLMKPGGGGSPAGALRDAISKDLGGFDKFKEDFAKAAMARFGSGWAWLVVRGGKLAVCSTANQDNPLMDVVDASQQARPSWASTSGSTPTTCTTRIAGPDYVSSWWNTVNWDEASRLFEAAGR